MTTYKMVIMLSGDAASGKTALARILGWYLQHYQKQNVKIINADSGQKVIPKADSEPDRLGYQTNITILDLDAYHKIDEYDFNKLKEMGIELPISFTKQSSSCQNKDRAGPTGTYVHNQLTEGTYRIAQERNRQIDEEGFTLESDQNFYDEDGSPLLKAAIAYANDSLVKNSVDMNDWPFEEETWKPSDDPVRNLEKAGALIAAEIDRILLNREKEQQQKSKRSNESAITAHDIISDIQVLFGKLKDKLGEE